MAASKYLCTMKTICLFAILIATALGGYAQTTYQVMTYNLRYNHAADGVNAWPNRKDKVAAIVQRADIVGCQEVLNDMLEDLDKRMKGYAHVGVGRDDGKKKGEYAPIFCKTDMFELMDHNNFWLS